MVNKTFGYRQCGDRTALELDKNPPQSEVQKRAGNLHSATKKSQKHFARSKPRRVRPGFRFPDLDTISAAQSSWVWWVVSRLSTPGQSPGRMRTPVPRKPMVTHALRKFARSRSRTVPLSKGHELNNWDTTSTLE